MAGSVTGEIRAEPNLTPLLDVVFQLITFFMLVTKFSTDNFDARIKLPVAGSARPVEGKRAAEDRLILNIDADGNLLWSGDVLDTERAIKELSTQAQLVRLNLKVAGKEVKPGEPLPTIIVIRADRRTSFSQLYRLITACQANGFTRFNLKAMTSEEG
jgi:biopolymer transport protein ExbD